MVQREDLNDENIESLFMNEYGITGIESALTDEINTFCSLDSPSDILEEEHIDLSNEQEFDKTVSRFHAIKERFEQEFDILLPNPLVELIDPHTVSPKQRRMLNGATIDFLLTACTVFPFSSHSQAASAAGMWVIGLLILNAGGYELITTFPKNKTLTEYILPYATPIASMSQEYYLQPIVLSPNVKYERNNLDHLFAQGYPDYILHSESKQFKRKKYNMNTHNYLRGIIVHAFQKVVQEVFVKKKTEFKRNQLWDLGNAYLSLCHEYDSPINYKLMEQVERVSKKERHGMIESISNKKNIWGEEIGMLMGRKLYHQGKTPTALLKYILTP